MNLKTMVKLYWKILSSTLNRGFSYEWEIYVVRFQKKMIFSSKKHVENKWILKMADHTKPLQSSIYLFTLTKPIVLGL